MVSIQRIDAAATANVPDLDSVVKRTGDDGISACVEVQAHNFCGVAEERVDLLPRLHIPEFGGVVHGTSGNQAAMRVEGQADNLRGVASKCVVQLARFCVPQARCFVKRASDNLITIGVVEGNGVHNVAVAFQGEQLISGGGVPDFACTVVTTRDELVA